MAFLEDLSPQEMCEAIQLLADGKLPLALTVRHQSRWVTFRTRAIAQHEGILWVEMPQEDQLPKDCRFRIGQRLGVSFSVAHRKFVFAARVDYLELYREEDGTQARAVRLDRPESMRKVERRLHKRLALPFDEMTRATFWLGGWLARPVEASVEAPVWSGRVLNISDGGLLVRTSYEAAKYVEVGDILGVQVLFGQEEQAAFVDAQLRHVARDGEMALLGFQFVAGEPEGDDGAGLEMIRRRIEERARQLEGQASPA
jgi:hypothetical protein